MKFSTEVNKLTRLKVALITRHAISNYGSLLQTIATQNVITNLGYECLTIDYIRRNESIVKRELTLLGNKPEYNKLIKRLAYLLVRWPMSIIAGKKFAKIRRH